MTNTTLELTVLALIGLGIGVGDVHADKAKLEGQFEQNLATTLEDVTIAQALEQIGRKAGVKMALSPEAVGKLPEGEQTRLSVTLEGRLADSLEEMLNSFFMRYAVGRGSLTIYPRPELKRIIGRPTADELKLLRNIYGNPMWVSTSAREIQEGFVQKVFNGMAREPVDIMPPDEMRTIEATTYKMMTKSMSSSASPRDPNAPKGAPLTIATILEGFEQSTNNVKTWYIQGPAFPHQVSTIRIVDGEEFRQARLNQVIDVSFSGEKGQSIVRMLATWAGLDVQVANVTTGHWLDQEITLEVQNVRLIDALDKALSSLGVEWQLNGNVLRVYRVGAEKPASKPVHAAGEVPAAGGYGYVGKISIPMDGGRYFIEFMLRESDLPEELRKLRQQAMNEVIAELSREGKIQEVLKQLSSEPAPK